MATGIFDARTPDEKKPGIPKGRAHPVNWPTWAQNTLIGAGALFAAIMAACGAVPALGIIAHGLWNLFMFGWGMVR
jgi:hypothetical protein